MTRMSGIAMACVLALGCSSNNAVVDAAGASDSAGSSDGAGSASHEFSFFVTSYAGLKQLSSSTMGFGGDLRFGETGPGAGLRGADKICATLAEASLPGSGAKTWHAFLSVSDDGTGHQVDAIERIGKGPWYDRLGRLLAPSLADLMSTRPANGDPTIKDDFPNEDGVPNHDPDGTGNVDNHDMLTGSTTSGRLYAASATCLDWTAATGDKATEGRPQVGHSWPRFSGGGGPGGMDNWKSALTESGCAPGVNLIETGPPDPNANTVGSGGGYGGFYCFVVTP